MQNGAYNLYPIPHLQHNSYIYSDLPSFNESSEVTRLEEVTQPKINQFQVPESQDWVTFRDQNNTEDKENYNWRELESRIHKLKRKMLENTCSENFEIQNQNFEKKRRCHSVNTWKPKRKHSRNCRQSFSKENADLDLIRIDRFSQNKHYVQGIFQVIKDHCLKCPELLEKVHRYNSSFAKKNSKILKQLK